jgi:hypothetical protein
MSRRFALAGVVVVALAAFGIAGGAVAGPASSVPIDWVFVGQGASGAPPSADTLACPFVPAGMWVQGRGTWTFFSPTGDAGNLQSEAHGTATDSAGGSYRWNYHQSIQPIGDGTTSRVVDEFVLAGSGAAGGIRSHFIAIIDGTDIETATQFDPVLVKGDPFDCDPI